MKRIAHRYTQEENEYIKKWGPHFGAKKIAEDFGVNRRSMQSKFCDLGVRLNPREKRLCCYCKKNYISHTGPRCSICARNKCINDSIVRTAKNVLKVKAQSFIWTSSRTAKKQNIPHSLFVEDIIELYNKQNGKCYYSGLPMSLNGYGTGRDWFAMSVDRKEPSLGYTKNNCVLCCRIINTAKMSLSIDDFLELMETTVNYCKEHNVSNRTAN